MTSSPLHLHPTTSSRAPREDGDQRIAAIDIGSNSIRQIIADVSPTGAIRVIDEMKAAPRLQTGLLETGALGEEPMRLALEALGRMAALAKQIGCKRVDAVATSAVRGASNGAAFLRQIKEQTGLRVRMLEGEEEARLAFRSALAHFDLGRGRAIVMDIGGGSLEFALAAEGIVERYVSLPFGAVRLTEEFLRDRPTPKGIRKLRKAVREELRETIPVHDWRGAEVIGSGGTFTNLAGMFLARQGVRVAHSVHGTRMPWHEIEHILEMLQELTPAERLSVPGLNAGRADIIVAGLAVAAEVCSRVEPRTFVASAYGIREGLLLDIARVTPVVSDPGEARERSVREFAERCHFEEPHARQVQRLAMQLFDAIGSRIGCSPADRGILSDAALLHDVGYHINYQKHHKHSFHLIQHADFLGMTPDEQTIVAHVARYHRGSTPDRTRHEMFGKLDRSTRERIQRLAALLRVADGFDRGHSAAVLQLKVRWMDRAMRITAHPDPRAKTMRLELWGANRKKELLEEMAGTPVEIVTPDGRVVSPDEDG
ncbi:MAG: Ppx/GppA phosphatase family protein [Gemmatimonadetes bacterium]|nr:Ppx/GppA phosphatase family protein [Gemmatimonadota bacterium]